MSISQQISKYQQKLYTLIFVTRNSEILLGFKKRGLGVGKWNGFGGKVEKDETVMEGAKRELKEESNLDSNNLNHIGVVTYEVENRNVLDVVHVFTTNSFSGEILESEEMKPKWYQKENVPFSQMWPDAKLWYPFVLSDTYFSAYIKYDENIVNVRNADIKKFPSEKLFLQSLN